MAEHRVEDDTVQSEGEKDGSEGGDEEPDTLKDRFVETEGEVPDGGHTGVPIIGSNVVAQFERDHVWNGLLSQEVLLKIT